MRILVLGYYYSSNLGDAVICECVASILKKYFPDDKIIIRDVCGRTEFPANGSEGIHISNDVLHEEPEKTENRILTEYKKHYGKMRFAEKASRFTSFDLEYIREAKKMAGRSEKIRKIAKTDCDAVVFAGGQMFMDSLMVCMNYFIHAFRRRGIPIFINACGTGPVSSRTIKKQTAEALMDPCVKWISCRDHADLVTKRYLKGTKKAVEVSDPALWSDQVYERFLMESPALDKEKDKKGCNDQERSGKTTLIGLGIMLPYNMSQKKLTEFWKRMIGYLDSREIPWMVALNGGEMDYAFAVSVLSQIPQYKEHPEDKILPVPHRPEELVRQISKLRGLISFRLHSHIIAASLKVPTVAVVWDDKVRAFFEKIGHPERCFRISDRPEIIWKAFEQEEAEGTDFGLIDGQRTASAKKLRDAIKAEFREK